MIIYTVVAVIVSWFVNRYYTGEGDTFFIPAIILGVMAFYRTLGDPIREDTSREFFLLVPEKNYTKILYSLLGCLAVTAIDLIVPMTVACIMVGSNPLVALIWLLFILSISFFATVVGTFISLSIPNDSAKHIAAFVQLMFLYFGLVPTGVIVIVGIVLNQITIAIAIGTVVNAVTGFLVSLLLPLFLGRK